MSTENAKAAASPEPTTTLKATEAAVDAAQNAAPVENTPTAPAAVVSTDDEVPLIAGAHSDAVSERPEYQDPSVLKNES